MGIARNDIRRGEWMQFTSILVPCLNNPCYIRIIASELAFSLVVTNVSFAFLWQCL